MRLAAGMTEMAITPGWVMLFLAVLAAISGAWWRVEGRVDRAKREASDKAESALRSAESVRGALEAHKLHVAEHYVSKEGLREVKDEIMSGMRDLKAGINHVTERLDRFIENPPQQAPRRTTKRAD